MSKDIKEVDNIEVEESDNIEVEQFEEEIESTDYITTERLVRKKGKANFIGIVVFGATLLISGIVIGSRIKNFTPNSKATTIKCVGGREYSSDKNLVDYEINGKSLVIYLEGDEKVVFRNKDMCTIEGD